MADKPNAVIGGKSPEEVAYLLTKDIADIEGRGLYPHADKPADRKWFLDTFAECLYAARGLRDFPGM
jgi:hypothetical protein